MARVIESDQSIAQPAEPIQPGTDAPCLLLDFVCNGPDQWCGIDFACGNNAAAA